MAATATTVVPPDVSLFLQDIIGKDGEALQDGKLRQYHARIVREVTQSKNDLHATVQKEWPNLNKQLRNSLELAVRLQDVQEDIARVEQELEGSDHSLRNRLTTVFNAHRSVLGRHTISGAQVELLATIDNAHRQLEQVQACLSAGSFDESVTGVLAVELYLANGFEPWKRESQHYTDLKERCEHLKALIREGLETAHDACFSYDVQHGLTIRSVYVEVAKRDISLANISNSLSKIGSVHHLQRTAKTIVNKLLLPIVKNRQQTLVQTIAATAIELRLQPASTLQTSFDQLKSLASVLDVLNVSYLAKDGPIARLRGPFFGDLFKTTQALLITHMLEASIPSNADVNDLQIFENTCKAVAAFEEKQISELGVEDVQSVLKQWTDTAPQHWSRSVIQKAYEELRKDIVSPEYWNKTRIVQWEDDESVNIHATNFEAIMVKALSEPTPAAASETKPDSPPIASPPQLLHSQPLNYEATITSPQGSSQSTKRDSSGNLKQSTSLFSPAEEDAWGFDDEEGDIDEPSLSPDASQTPPRAATPSQVNAVDVSNDRETAGSRSADPSKHVPINGSTHSVTPPRETGKTGNHGAAAAGPPVLANGHIESSPSAEAGEGWDFDDAVDSPRSVKQVSPELNVKPAAVQSISSRLDPVPAGVNDEEDAWASWDEPLAATSPVINMAVSTVKRGLSPAPQPKVGKLGAVRAADLSASKSHQGDSKTEALDSMLQPAFNESTTDSGLPPPKRIGPEPMMISQRCGSVLAAVQHLSEAAHATEQLSSYSSGTADLHQASNNVLDLYRALMPVAHAQLLESVPSLGMQYINDCTYISKENRLSATQSSALSTGTLSPSERLAQHAALKREEQIILQEKNLLSELDELDHLESVDVPDRFVAAQRTMHQLLASIECLAKAWKSVLRPSQYADSMGQIVDAVLTRVLEDIEGHEDISEEASKRLCVLCGVLHSVEPLFDVNGESQIALYVPVWFKYKFLSELLEASMADIMFLFNEGHLVDFERDELSNLVRALFADSPLRERNLAIIAGHARA